VPPYHELLNIIDSPTYVEFGSGVSEVMYTLPSAEFTDTVTVVDDAPADGLSESLTM
jgi:translation elongation factor EF-G